MPPNGSCFAPMSSGNGGGIRIFGAWLAAGGAPD